MAGRVVADCCQANLPGIQAYGVLGVSLGDAFIFSWVSGGRRKLVLTDLFGVKIRAGHTLDSATAWTNPATWTVSEFTWNNYSILNFRFDYCRRTGDVETCQDTREASAPAPRSVRHGELGTAEPSQTLVSSTESLRLQHGREPALAMDHEQTLKDVVAHASDSLTSRGLERKSEGQASMKHHDGQIPMAQDSKRQVEEAQVASEEFLEPYEKELASALSRKTMLEDMAHHAIVRLKTFGLSASSTDDANEVPVSQCEYMKLRTENLKLKQQVEVADARVRESENEVDQLTVLVASLQQDLGKIAVSCEARLQVLELSTNSVNDEKSVLNTENLKLKQQVEVANARLRDSEKNSDRLTVLVESLQQDLTKIAESCEARLQVLELSAISANNANSAPTSQSENVKLKIENLKLKQQVEGTTARVRDSEKEVDHLTMLVATLQQKLDIVEKRSKHSACQTSDSCVAAEKLRSRHMGNDSVQAAASLGSIQIVAARADQKVHQRSFLQRRSLTSSSDIVPSHDRR